MLWEWAPPETWGHRLGPSMCWELSLPPFRAWSWGSGEGRAHSFGVLFPLVPSIIFIHPFMHGLTYPATSASRRKSQEESREVRGSWTLLLPRNFSALSLVVFLFLLQTFVAFGATDLDLALKSQSSVDNFLFLFPLPVVLHIYKLNRLQVDLPFS